ncbi:MAG: polyamine aminopropyltransferase [Bacteroidia bacterium]|nr:polyamine aminopropyltransferase [Bacteroidia bacterium]
MDPTSSQQEEHLQPGLTASHTALLLVSVAIISICAILYELLISTISSYFQGSSILHFSLVIGLFLSFMGLGSYLSKFVIRGLLRWFILFEIWLGIIGGFSSAILYLAFSLTPYFYLTAFILLGTLGTLIGLEIPLLTRMINRYEGLRDAMAKVLSFDYLGALIASVLFPLLLLPTLGVMRTAFGIGMLNLVVAALNTWQFRADLPDYRRMIILCTLGGGLLLAGFGYSFQITRFFENFLYQDEIMLSRQSAYQQIVITQWNDDTRLFLDGNLQFSSKDEYRYHEPLVHIPLQLAAHTGRILILGGGDGMVAREVLKHAQVQTVDLVDLDPEITRLATSHPVLIRLNDSSMLDPRVRIVNEDGYKFIENGTDLYDVIIIDLPDPNHTALGKLYTAEFYGLISRRLAAGGVVVTQSTSPYFAPRAFWCIHHTLASVFPATIPYQVYVPSFGQWGFNLALKTSPRLAGLHAGPAQDSLLHSLTRRLQERPVSLRYLTPAIAATLFVFDGDTQAVPAEVNHLDNQILVQYYENSWNQWR